MSLRAADRGGGVAKNLSWGASPSFPPVLFFLAFLLPFRFLSPFLFYFFLSSSLSFFFFSVKEGPCLPFFPSFSPFFLLFFVTFPPFFLVFSPLYSSLFPFFSLEAKRLNFS